MEKRMIVGFLMIGLPIIIAIETFQYFIRRSADIDDLIMNTFGGTIGCGIFYLYNQCFADKAWWKKAIS